jgi:hypothetical protein
MNSYLYSSNSHTCLYVGVLWLALAHISLSKRQVIACLSTVILWRHLYQTCCAQNLTEVWKWSMDTGHIGPLMILSGPYCFKVNVQKLFIRDSKCLIAMSACALLSHQCSLIVNDVQNIYCVTQFWYEMAYQSRIHSLIMMTFSILYFLPSCVWQ